MDNITHTLIGVLVGETAARLASAAQSRISQEERRKLFVGVMAVGSNLPDLDFLYSFFTGNKLDYLLQHRGYTHTIAGAALMALLMFAACEIWLRHRGVTPTRSDRIWLGSIALLAPLLHIAMDFTNSYGVHPFWPFYNGWLYGDSVFIVEPLFWAAAAPLLFISRTLLARTLVGLVLAAGIVLSFGAGVVPTSLALALVLLTSVMLALGRYAPARTALLVAIGVWLGCTTMFAVAGRAAAKEIAAIAQRDFASEHTLDRVLTPTPANPLCWEVILVQSRHAHYVLRRGLFSLAPQWIPADRCPSRDLQAAITAPLTTTQAANSLSMQWRGEALMSKDQLQQLAATYCQAADLLRFARAPFFVQHGAGWILGDLRYDREDGLGFSEIQLGERDRCPSFVPGWQPPRIDLLN